jgi:hypothetical protein
MPVAFPIDSLQAPLCSLAASRCRKKSAGLPYNDDIACRSYICPLSLECSEGGRYKAMRYLGYCVFPDKTNKILARSHGQRNLRLRYNLYTFDAVKLTSNGVWGGGG